MGGARGGVDPVGPASDGQRRGRAQDRRGSLAGGQVGERRRVAPGARAFAMCRQVSTR